MTKQEEEIQLSQQNSSNIQIDNSFTLGFTNTTNDTQKIVLFREGTNTINDVKGVVSTGRTTAQNNQYPLLRLITIWNTTLLQPYNYFGNPNLPTLTSYPTLEDITIKGTGNIQLVSDNEISPSVFSTINVAVVDGESISSVNDKINDAIRKLSDTTNFKNSKGDVMQLFLTIDFTILNSQTLPITTAGFTAPFGISVQYPYPSDLAIGSTGNPIRLKEIICPPSVNPPFSFIDLCPLSVPKASANGVEVVGLSNISYEAIKESQNGSILDVNSLVVNIGNAPSEQEKQSQLLQPYLFKKIDVNGNEVELIKTQVIDPYQQQYSYSKVDMTDDGEQFILDGNTKFEYKVEPSTSVNITFNYILIKNSNYGSQETAIGVENDLINIAQLSENTQYASTQELVIQNQNADLLIKKNRKKQKYLINLFIGILALYVLTNLKSNQKL